MSIFKCFPPLSDAITCFFMDPQSILHLFRKIVKNLAGDTVWAQSFKSGASSYSREIKTSKDITLKTFQQLTSFLKSSLFF